ncbi:HNH endonuclease family protein [Amycolatopsis sp. NPDC054798]
MKKQLLPDKVSRVRFVALAACVFATGGLAAKCAPTLPANAGGPSPAAAVSPGRDVTTTRSKLARLVVAPRTSGTGYTDDKFPHWSNQPGAGRGCDTREAVLRRAGRDVTVDGQCRPTSGTWVSPYDGQTWTKPGQLDIDHVVPRKHAWRTGAAAWTQEKREQFANDLVRPELVAVTSAVNRQKGDKAPDEWKPPSTSDWCQYAVDWITDKDFYRLTVTRPEIAALDSMLGRC